MKRFAVLCLTLVMALSLVACGGGNNNDGGAVNPTDPIVLDLPAIYEKMTQAATMAEMYEMDADLMLALYGLQAEDMKQFVVMGCAEPLLADEVWLIEAVDAAAAERIKTLANACLEQKDAVSETYSPEQNAVVKKAQLLQQGNYIALIVSPNVEALAQVFRTEAGL